jgi:hypothetical protein
MLSIVFALPLAQTFVSPPSSGGLRWTSDPMLLVAVFGLGLLWLLVVLLRRRARKPVVVRTRPILVDGSNVIHWQDNTPQLEPLLQVVQNLTILGLRPGVVFDANVGYKLTGRFLGEGDLSRLLSLQRDQILVVPKGTQADYYLLETARDLKAQIVTNDRFRDWADDYPEVADPGKLIRGGMREGRIWLTGLEAEATAAP